MGSPFEANYFGADAGRRLLGDREWVSKPLDRLAAETAGGRAGLQLRQWHLLRRADQSIAKGYLRRWCVKPLEWLVSGDRRDGHLNSRGSQFSSCWEMQ